MIPGGATAATRNDPDYRGVTTMTPAPPTFTDSSQLIAQLYTNPDLATLQTQLKLAGYGNVNPTGIVDSDTISAYTQLLKDTAAYAATGGTGYTPETLLTAKIAANNKLGLNGAGGSGAQPSMLTDPLVAQAYLKASLSAALGRNPNPDEVAQYQALLTGYAAQPNASSTGAQQLADNFTMGSQSRANEAGALNESRFFDVLNSVLKG